jgi:hypothetical protein
MTCLLIPKSYIHKLYDEAHRERRRLKHEAIKRISEFITNIES